MLYLAHRDESCVELSISDRKELISYYNQVYYQYKQNGCEDCREKRLHEIEIEFNAFLSRIKESY
jgi:hypothetical protein